MVDFLKNGISPKILFIVAIFIIFIGLYIEYFYISVIAIIFWVYSFGIWGRKWEEGIHLEKWRKGIEGIIKFFLIILILMSIAKIGNVLIYNFINPISHQQIVGNFSIKADNNLITLNRSLSEKSLNVTYYAKYEGINPDKLSFNLTKDEESFAYVVNLYTPREAGQIYIPNIPENKNVEALNQPIKNNPIDISREFTFDRKINYLQNFFSNLSFDFIRSEIGMILFLIILINIFSLVPHLLNEESKDGKPDKSQEPKDGKMKELFSYLILTSLILALILTLSPEGDIGAVKLNISLGSSISAFLIIISFILVYLFKDDKAWFKK